MKIISLSYKNNSIDWTLKEVRFQSLTLLVGASGIGKTRILTSVLNLKKIVQGASMNGLEWAIRFTTRSGNEFCWTGRFENLGFSTQSPLVDPSKIDDEKRPKIEVERLLINGKVVIDRDTESILFNGSPTVKLSRNKSTLNLLKEEDQIREIHQAFGRIIFNDNTQPSQLPIIYIGRKPDTLDELSSLDSIRESNLPIAKKIDLVCSNQPKEFEKIVASFIEVFPTVTDVKVGPLEPVDSESPPWLRELSLIQIKEQGIPGWIDQTKLSAGMIRTLLHIADLHLCADSSVILIDEFENSLGVNCIDELTSSILSTQRDLQFIITSHHPYIINNIDKSHWNLVTRKGGIVTVHDSSEFDFGKSKHQAFTQLMNLDAFNDGVTS